MVAVMDKPQTFGKFNAGADADIEWAAKRREVDPSLLKAIIAKESAGDWENSNRLAYANSTGRIHPYVGITERIANAHGIDFDSLIGNRAAQVDALAKILRSMFVDSVNELVARRWHSGSGLPYLPSSSQYVDDVVRWSRKIRNG